MARKDNDTSTDSAETQVQERVNAEQERGYRGIEVDPTPNENYSVAGVTSGAPTPETDADAAEAARKAQADTARLAEGSASRLQK